MKNFIVLTLIALFLEQIIAITNSTSSRRIINDFDGLNFLLDFIAVADVDCGTSSLKTRTAMKIVNGEEAAEGEFPWY